MACFKKPPTRNPDAPMRIPHGRVLLALLGACLFAGCDPSVPKGRILVKNDSRDSEYNVVEVSGGGAYASLKPGETKLMPSGTTSLSFSRRYKDHTRSYSVSCPSIGKGIVIKLIDVHLNRIAGGCKTTSATKG